MTFRSVVPLAGALFALLVAPAEAALTFTRATDKNPYGARIWIADDNGANARVLARGEYAWLSPDGMRAAVTDYTFKNDQLTKQALTIYPTAGGPGAAVA